jgi:hypothetical protein
MKHMHPIYDHIQDTTGLIAEDEPVILVRASRPAFLYMVENYLTYLKMDLDDAEKRMLIPLVQDHMLLGIAWRRTHDMVKFNGPGGTPDRMKRNKDLEALLSREVKKEAVRILADALYDAQKVLKDYIRPGHTLTAEEAAEKVHKLLGVLDNAPLSLAQAVVKRT